MTIRLRYPELAPEGVATLSATEHYLNATTALPAVLLELVRLRVSLANGCEFCVGHHTNELRKHNEPDTRSEALRDWVNSDAFTPKERAALAWADSITNIQTRAASDADYAAVSTFFHEKDLVDLTLAIASINAWNRMSIAFRAEWDPGHAAHRPKATVALENSARSDWKEKAPSNPATETLSQATSAHEDAPTQDVVDDDGGKVAQD